VTSGTAAGDGGSWVVEAGTSPRGPQAAASRRAGTGQRIRMRVIRPQLMLDLESITLEAGNSQASKGRGIGRVAGLELPIGGREGPTKARGGP
jgi:hypothetical protein